MARCVLIIFLDVSVSFVKAGLVAKLVFEPEYFSKFAKKNFYSLQFLLKINVFNSEREKTVLVV